MKKLNLSKFDLGIIIAAVVIALLGGGGYFYLSGLLSSAQDDVHAAKSSFDTYSASKSAGGATIVVSPANATTLQNNINLLKAQLDPLINTKLLAKDNKLSSVVKEDPVAWKAGLDATVQRLKTSAKAHNVDLPPSFYFGFSRYVSQSPNAEQTTVLGKQLLGLDELSNILINLQIKDIGALRRTYEEDPHSNFGNNGGSGAADPDQLGGYSSRGPGNSYISYPFEVEFETTSEVQNLRDFIDNLAQSPYIFVIRSISVENSQPDSPMVSDLERIAGPPPAPMTDSSPGAVAATTSTKGPQYLFGNGTLRVKARIDLIEWTAQLPAENPAPAQNNQRRNPASPGGN